MSTIDEVSIEVDCAVSGRSAAAKAVCTGESVWIVRPECSKNSGHHRKVAWTPCCDACRTLVGHNSFICPQCGARATLKADLL